MPGKRLNSLISGSDAIIAKTYEQFSMNCEVAYMLFILQTFAGEKKSSLYFRPTKPSFQ